MPPDSFHNLLIVIFQANTGRKKNKLLLLIIFRDGNEIMISSLLKSIKNLKKNLLKLNQLQFLVILAFSMKSSHRPQ